MSAWERAGLTLYFLTLTSAAPVGHAGAGRAGCVGGGAPSLRAGREAGSVDLSVAGAPGIMEHWQALRKRLARHLGVDAGAIQYRGVRTTEGHGVLHLVVAVSPEITGHRWRLVDFENLQRWWREIHGAWHVNIKRISRGGGASRRVSRYVVSQYLVRQGGELVDALVRTFGSRLELRLPQLRRQFRALVWWRRCDQVAGLRDSMEPRELWRSFWRAFRGAWAALLERGSVALWGCTAVLVQVLGEWRIEEA